MSGSISADTIVGSGTTPSNVTLAADWSRSSYVNATTATYYSYITDDASL